METIHSPLTLLAELKPARDAVSQAGRGLRPTCDVSRALGEVTTALHALAKELGHPDYFLDEPHRTP